MRVPSLSVHLDPSESPVDHQKNARELRKCCDADAQVPQQIISFG